MKDKLNKLWRRFFPAPIDTTPDHFDAWFKRKIGERLQGNDVYFCIGIVGQNNVPRIGKNFKVFSELKDAEKERKDLQYDNPSLKLEIKLVRVFYSVPEVK